MMPAGKDLYYRLDGHEPVPCSFEEYAARWTESDPKDGAAGRRVALDDVHGVQVSTVFLGIDHAFGPGRPLLFETMLFGPALSAVEQPEDRRYLRENQWRWHSWDEAASGHQRIVAALRNGTALPEE